MKKKTKLISLLSIVSVMLLASVSTSLAWFTKSNFITTNEGNPIKGGMFTGYFHCGSGTTDDPFVITKPVHWENLVWLHNNVDGFWKAMRKDSELQEARGFDFQIGYNLDGTGIPKVYKFDENGQVFDGEDPVYDTTLNLACLDDLIPIGSPQYPFVGTMNGNDLTISNFNIVSYDKYDKSHLPLEDIGIFGYVGDITVEGATVGPIHNIYFTHFNIDTKDSSLVKDDSQLYQHHPSHIDPDTHEGDVCTGYIAGHALKALSFTDVYVNDCTIDGKADDSGGQKNTYGYFGRVEFSAEGDNIGQGTKYSFELNAEKVYDYLEDKYFGSTNLGQSPIATYSKNYSDAKDENVIYNSDYSVNLDKDNLFDGKVTKHPVNDGISYIEKGIAGWRSTYNLVGADPDSTYTGPTNYSLSSLGYWPMSDQGKNTDFAAVYKDNSGNFQYLDTSLPVPEYDPATHEAVADSSVYEDDILKFDQNIAKIRYVRNPGSSQSQTGWEYYRVHTSSGEKKNVKINCVTNADSQGKAREFTFTFSAYTLNNPAEDYLNAYLVVDDQLRDPIPLSSSQMWTTIEKGGLFANDKITYHLNINLSFDYELTVGTHKLAFMALWRNKNTNANDFSAAYANANGASARFVNAGRVGGSGEFRCTSLGSYEVTDSTTSITLNMNTGLNSENINGTSAPYLTFESGILQPAKPILYPESGTYPIYGSITEPGQPIDTSCDFLPKDPTIIFNVQSGTYPSTTDFHYEGGYNVQEVDGLYNSVTRSGSGGTDGWAGTYTCSKDGGTDTIIINGNGTGKLNGINITYSINDDNTLLRITREYNSNGLDYTDVYYIRKVANEIEYKRWNAHYEAPKSIVDGTTEPNWIGEELEEYTKEDEGGGYKRANIDVVGGGIRFGPNYITFDGEQRETTLVKTITASDIGTKWYANKYAANSVCLYVKNVAGTNPLDQIGTVEIDYSWLTVFNELSFKKGQGLGTPYLDYLIYRRGNCVKIDQIGRTQDQTIETDQELLHKNVKLKLRRQAMKNAAFCALDADKNIVANYDYQGNQVYPQNRTVKESEIAYYVLVVGIQNPLLGSDINTRINYIKFAYNADLGEGGSFGRVEYRENPLIEEKTVFNLAYRVPENDYIRVHVTYGTYNASGEFVDDKRYYINLYYYSPTDATRKLELFLYLYNDQYEVYLCTDPNNPSSYTRVCENVNEQVLVDSHNFL